MLDLHPPQQHASTHVRRRGHDKPTRSKRMGMALLSAVLLASVLFLGAGAASAQTDLNCGMRPNDGCTEYEDRWKGSGAGYCGVKKSSSHTTRAYAGTWSWNNRVYVRYVYTTTTTAWYEGGNIVCPANVTTSTRTRSFYSHTTSTTSYR